MNTPALYSIKITAQKTGLTTHTIRMWEKRYGAVAPARTDSRRRLYSEDEVERLRLLRRVTEAGHRIGDVAHLDGASLEALAPPESEREPPAEARSSSANELLTDALAAVRELEASKLDTALERAELALGHQGLLTKLVAPLAEEIGERWFNGDLTAAHEHFASNIIRTYLLRGTGAFASDSAAPLLIAATPAGQLHELGAAMVASAARAQGWRVIYLGASLPAAEIAGAAIKHNAKVVALSIVYPPDDPNLADEVKRLRRLLPKGTQLLVGGRAVKSYDTALLQEGVEVFPELNLSTIGRLEVR